MQAPGLEMRRHPARSALLDHAAVYVTLRSGRDLMRAVTPLCCGKPYLDNVVSLETVVESSVHIA